MPRSHALSYQGASCDGQGQESRVLGNAHVEKLNHMRAHRSKNCSHGVRDHTVTGQ